MLLPSTLTKHLDVYTMKKLLLFTEQGAVITLFTYCTLHLEGIKNSYSKPQPSMYPLLSETESQNPFSPSIKLRGHSDARVAFS